MSRIERFWILGLALTVAAAAGLGRPAEAGRQEIPEEGPRRIVVPAAAGWVDAGIDVEEGDTVLFRAEGEITLQRGNPVAQCGPAGLDLRTVQQPILDLNLGALIGKVAQLISLRIDEDTGEEIRDEILSLFPIGRGGQVVMPMRGRLLLGINESVVKDNGGEFAVFVIRVRD